MKFLQLLREAQFHGGQLLADREFRWLWMCSLCGLVVVAWSSVLGAVDRFLDNPTHMVVQDTPMTVPFPSVVVCLSPYFTDGNVNRFVDDIEIPEYTNATYIRSIVQQLAAFYAPEVRYKLQDLQLLERILRHNGLSVEEAAFSLTGTCDEIIVRCRFINKFKNCSDMFTKMLTNIGVCCVYNGRSIRREITSGSYGTSQDPPLQVSSAGFSNALMLAVDLQKSVTADLNYTRVTVQRSQMYAEVSKNGTPLQPRSELWVGYRGHRILIGLEAKKLGDGLLGCRMTHERLKFFPIYRQRFCYSECTMAKIWKRCGCLSLHHPLAPGWRHCQARDLNCLHLARKEPAYAGDCFCPKSCEQTEAQLLMQSFSLAQDAPVLDQFYRGLNYSEVSVLRVFTLHRNTRTKQRRSYYDAIHLFSQLGGIFNVYLGCSVLTSLELLQLLWHYIKAVRNSRSRKLTMVKPKEKNSNKQRIETKPKTSRFKEGLTGRY